MQTHPIHFTPTSKHRFHLLDALRGLAALIVVPRHVMGELVAPFSVHNTYLAVDFFFCLSGLVIAFSYEERLRTRLRLRDFMAARVIRLYPLALLGATAAILHYILLAHVWRSPAERIPFVVSASLALLVLPTCFGSFSLNGPAWSIFFEMVANFCYAMLVRLKLLSNRITIGICAASLVAIVVFAYSHPDLDGGFTRSTLAFGLARVGFSFFIGVLLFRLYRRAGPWRFRNTIGVIVAILLAGALLISLAFSSRLSESPFLAVFIIAIIFPSIVYLGSKVDLPHQWTKYCAFLGDMSYPLYILHVPFLGAFLHGVSAPYAASHRWYQLYGSPIYIGLLIAGAWCIQKYFDIPVRRFLTSRYKRTSDLDQQPMKSYATK